MSYRKKPFTDTCIMPFGKYANYKMIEITDTQYMEWFVKEMENSNKYKRLIRAYFINRLKEK